MDNLDDDCGYVGQDGGQAANQRAVIRVYSRPFVVYRALHAEVQLR